MYTAQLLAISRRFDCMKTAREAFLEQSAMWSANINAEARFPEAFDSKAQAFLADPAFAEVLFDKSAVANATSELSLGCDLITSISGQWEGFFLLPQAVVDTFEDTFFSLEGAQVCLGGSGRFALALAYECARAGAKSVLLVDSDTQRAKDNLEAFLNLYFRLKGTVTDMRQALPGHVSFLQAYEQCDYVCGSPQNNPKTIASSDVVINASPQAVDKELLSVIGARANMFLVDPLSNAAESSLLAQSAAPRSLAIDAEAIWYTWGTLAAKALIGTTKLI